MSLEKIKENIINQIVGITEAVNTSFWKKEEHYLVKFNEELNNVKVTFIPLENTIIIAFSENNISIRQTENSYKTVVNYSDLKENDFILKYSLDRKSSMYYVKSELIFKDEDSINLIDVPASTFLYKKTIMNKVRKLIAHWNKNKVIEFNNKLAEFTTVLNAELEKQIKKDLLKSSILDFSKLELFLPENLFEGNPENEIVENDGKRYIKILDTDYNISLASNRVKYDGEWYSDYLLLYNHEKNRWKDALL